MKNLYFAYGSNLNSKDWKKWCKENNANPDVLNPLPGVHILPDYELAFHYYSKSRKGGAVDVVKRAGHAVAGKVFEIKSREGWETLDKKEGAPHNYKRKKVNLLTEQNEQTTAYTYMVAEKARQRDYVPPTSEYVSIVANGYKEQDIPIKYPWAMVQFFLVGDAPIKMPIITHLFVYGTFREGEEKADMLANFSEPVSLDCHIKGSLIHLPEGRPGLVAGEEDDWVTGEIHRASDIQAALKTMDEEKNFTGYNKQGSEYIRGLINCGSIHCWAYPWKGPIDAGPVIQSGDWCNKD